MIKVVLNDIVMATDTLNKIMQQSFKGSLAFKIARLARELGKEMQTFNTEKQKLIEKYAKRNNDGEFLVDDKGNIIFPNDKIDEINEEFKALLETELEINADKLPIEAIDSFEITPQEILNIEKFFNE